MGVVGSNKGRRNAWGKMMATDDKWGCGLQHVKPDAAHPVLAGLRRANVGKMIGGNQFWETGRPVS